MSRPAAAVNRVIKAYDVRGTVPDQLNAEVACALGVAFARHAGAAELLVGRDMRPSGPELAGSISAMEITTGSPLACGRPPGAASRGMTGRRTGRDQHRTSHGQPSGECFTSPPGSWVA